jgi:SPP1 gp7 family putative phage head morphogenesis protein
MTLSRAPWLPTTFAAESPLIPTATITTALDEVESIWAAAIVAQTEAEVEKLVSKAGRKSAPPIAEIESLTWALSPLVQTKIYSLWLNGYQVGCQHGIDEMVAAVPESAKSRATFELSNQTLSLIAALLTQQPNLIFSAAAQAAVIARVLQIAGNYSKDLLSAVKGHLVAAIIPGADGQPITRKELESRIQKTLGLTKQRAELIARNELTAAYNRGRVTEFQKSGLVTHCRFLAILDGRTSDICRSRNGMLIPMADTALLAANTPGLHHRCRSVLSPVMPAVSADHQAWVEDGDRDPRNRSLVPLPQGWRS